MRPEMSFITEKEKTEIPVTTTAVEGVVISDANEKKERFNKIPLTEEDQNLSGVEFANKYGLSIKSACDIKKQGYRSMPFSRQPLNEKQIERRKELKMKIGEIEDLEINSIETALVTPNEQEKIKKIVEEYNTVLNESGLKNQKLFKLENGKEISLGDLVVLDKIAEKRVFRDENDQLMMFDKNEDKFIPFNPRSFFGQKKSYNFRDNFKGVNTESKKARYSIIALESFAPQVFKLGIFKDKDFDKRSAGSISYEINGPHERSLSKTSPYVFFSSTNSRANYYIGKEKFVGTNKKINHDTVRVSLLDNNTGVVTDIINGRKLILYTFPLLSKEQYEEKKEKVIQKQINQNNQNNQKRINDHITESASLKEYFITDYVSKNSNESDKDYNERISKLSDLSYVLGNFRSFMSETGLAANNYSWKEQLVLANALTSVEDEEKIKRFGKNFGKNGLRTFLSLEQVKKEDGKKMGDKILELGEKLPEDASREVFAKYGEIVDIADNIHKILEDILPKQVLDESQKEIFEIKESLLNRAKDLLSTFYDNKNNNSEQLLRDLKRYKSEILLYADTYKKLKDSGKEIHLEDIKNTEITVLSQEEKEEIAKNLWSITRANRPFIKEGTEEMIDREKNFNLTIENKNSNFYVLKYKDEVISFCSVTPDENGDLYLESLNTESEVKGSQIGGAFLPAVLEKIKDKGKNIYGHVHPQNPGTLPYYERLGFKIQEIKEGGVLKYYEIKIPISQEVKKAA